jgi:hypothetical protein
MSKVSAPETPLSYPWYGRADLEEIVTVASASSRSLGIAGSFLLQFLTKDIDPFQQRAVRSRFYMM